MRVAIVHDWLTGMRGGERVLEALLGMYRDAEIFTLLHVPGSVSSAIERRPIHTSFLQHLPGAGTRYRYYLPLFPRAVASLDVAGAELVISVSHAVAKGVRVPRGVPHVCYCLTPMRYVWDRYDDYFGRDSANVAVRAAAAVLAPRLRAWDRRTAESVTRFVAISEHVRGRIRRAYDRTAGLVYPPVEIERFRAGTREDFYLVVSALVRDKRIDLAIAACASLGRRLVIVGQGPDRARLERLAGPEVTFTGWLDDASVADHYARCRALLVPGEEDFGITAVEAQAAGAPVVAYGKGGVTESVVPVNGSDPACDAPTGVLFAAPTAEALAAAIRLLETSTFNPATLQANAAVFSAERFRREFEAEVTALRLAGAARTLAEKPVVGGH